MKLIAIVAFSLLSVSLGNTIVPQENVPGLQAEGKSDDRSLFEQALDFFTTITDSSSWPARWDTGHWSSFHGWLYIISDLVIWLSYFMIPLILTYFYVRKKKESLPFQSILLLFIVFILSCGLTHLIDALIFWWPVYKLSALIRLVTATVSLATVFALIRIAPRVMELKGPRIMEDMIANRTAELQLLNRRLQNEIQQREAIEQELKHLNAELERKTRWLQETNETLTRREHDIIEREEKIKQLNHDLERKVSERTEQLHTSNQELEAFTYSVSHDLRAPLRAIDGYARILEEDYDPRLDSHGKHLIKVITKNARYMGNLIDDLLEFSRTSRTELIKSVFHSDEEVRKIASDLMIHEKNRAVEIDIRALEKTYGDVMMLRQVWINLIANALKYSRKTEQARIEIGCTKANDQTHFYIKDNGVGFDMEYMDKLFGVFQRLHKKEDFEGTGVGLALVKRILDRHKGKVWAEAAVNEGATFYFTIPG
jgi:signal transduction histidine kinase